MIGRLRGVTWRDVGGVVRAAATLCRVSRALREDDFLRVLDQMGLTESSHEAAAADIEETRRWVRWAHRLVPLEPNCLLDSLAAAVLLRGRGVCAPLSIGVRQCQGNFEAHAWLGDSQADPGEGFRLLYRVPEDPLPRSQTATAGRAQ